MAAQTKLFGSFAKEKTYFNHEAKTSYEKCVEPFYFFNKQKMSKENCLKGAIELWRELKHKKDEFREYIEKHKTCLAATKTRKFKGFCKILQDEKPISSKTTVAIGPTDSPASSTTTATCFNAEEYVNLTVEPSILTFDIITKDFLEGLEPGLSIFLETIETDKLAMLSIDSLAKCYNISEQIKVLGACKRFGQCMY